MVDALDALLDRLIMLGDPEFEALHDALLAADRGRDAEDRAMRRCRVALLRARGFDFEEIAERVGFSRRTIEGDFAALRAAMLESGYAEAA